MNTNALGTTPADQSRAGTGAPASTPVRVGRARSLALIPRLGVRFLRAPASAIGLIGSLGERGTLHFPGGAPVHWTSSPQDVRAIFGDREQALDFGEGLRRTAPHEAVFGTTMMRYFEEPLHMALRRQMSNIMAGDALRSYEARMIQAAEQHVERWPVDEPLCLVDQTTHLARDVIVRAVLGELGDDRRARLELLLEQLDAYYQTAEMASLTGLAMLRGGKWRGIGKLNRINAAVDAITLEEIAARRAHPEVEHVDGLQSILDTEASAIARGHAEIEALIDDVFIAQAARALLITGYETTAVTIAWIIERLVHHPEVLTKLEASVDRGEHDYLDAVITETMRMRPVVPMTQRAVRKPFDLNGMPLATGDLLLILITEVHAREDVYPDAHEFRPERFLDQRPGTYTWLPFGGGINRCPGAPFSMFEARVLLRTLIERRRLEVDPRPPQRLNRRLMLSSPATDWRITLRARADAGRPAPGAGPAGCPVDHAAQ